MALDCTLTADTDASDQQIRDVLKTCCGAEDLAEEGALRFRMPGALCAVIPASELSQELTMEHFGFRPTRQFVFRLEKFERFDEGLRNTIRACIALVRELSRDCVLFVMDDAVLLRRDRRLTLQASDDPARLEMLSALADGIDEAHFFAELPKV